MTDYSDHPWLGGLLGDAEIAALLSPQATLDRMIQVEAAWTRSIAPPKDADRIALVLQQASVRPADLAAGTARDGVPVPDLVRRLKDALPDEDHQWVHRGLTSQDVMDTGLVLAVQAILPILAQRLADVKAALDDLTARTRGRSMMAMTRMQPALPIQTADRIATWQRPVAALASGMPALMTRCAVLQWGGPVGVRDGGFAMQTGRIFADALGLHDPGASWHNDRAMLADLASVLSRMTGAVGKIGLDIGLMAQTDPTALALSGAGGSSAMPHKQNPVQAEVLVTLARRNAVDLSLMHQALLHEQERSGAAWMLEWLVLPQMLTTTACSLRVTNGLIGSITQMGVPQ